MNDTEMTMLYARHLLFYAGLIMKYQILLTHDSHETKSRFSTPASAVLALSDWTLSPVNRTGCILSSKCNGEVHAVMKKSFPRWIVPVWKADATSCDCLCLSRSEISFCLCFKVYISVLYRFPFFHRSVFLQKKRCEALSAFFYFISFPLPL